MTFKLWEFLIGISHKYTVPIVFKYENTMIFIIVFFLVAKD